MKEAMMNGVRGLPGAAAFYSSARLSTSNSNPVKPVKTMLLVGRMGKSCANPLK
jgi:hypothetical protein